MRFDKMSALFAVRDRRDLSAPQKATMVALVLRANDESRCWPSYERLAGDAAISRRTAIDAVRSLETAGLLRREAARDEAGDAAPNVYVITLGVVQDDHQVVQEPHHLVQETHHGGAPAAPRVVQEPHWGGAAPAPKARQGSKTEKQDTQGGAPKGDANQEGRRPDGEPRRSPIDRTLGSYLPDAYARGIAAGLSVDAWAKPTLLSEQDILSAIVQTHGRHAPDKVAWLEEQAREYARWERQPVKLFNFRDWANDHLSRPIAPPKMAPAPLPPPRTESERAANMSGAAKMIAILGSGGDS